MLRTAYHLGLRQTQGLMGSIGTLMGLDIRVPDYSTLSRRANGVSIAQVMRQAGSAPIHLLVDSTGLLREPLRRHGIRLTRQRELLFELIHNSHRHLNADQLYELAKERDPKINRVTVYRTLKLLKEEGLVDELDLMHYQGDQHYYETRLKREHAQAETGTRPPRLSRLRISDGVFW